LLGGRHWSSSLPFRRRPSRRAANELRMLLLQLLMLLGKQE
jgi:hypothetical protein